jgi:hypothetical protein
MYTMRRWLAKSELQVSSKGATVRMDEFPGAKLSAGVSIAPWTKLVLTQNSDAGVGKLMTVTISAK